MGSKLINVEGSNNTDENKYNSNNVVNINNKMNKNDYFIETNKELKINLNFQNNNIISNIFSNINVYDKLSNIFINNKKTYMLKYNNNINEENFFISYLEKKDDNNFVSISPWHNIDLKNDDGTYNMIVEISKYNYIKLEIQLKEKFNIIKQDKKKGKLRYYHNSIYWNYGALPQTYEYPKHIYQNKSKTNNEPLFFNGDNDPLDIIDIGSASLKIGQVVPVKILGAFTLIDEGELDWKIIAINKEDKHYEDINSLSDIDKYYPHTLSLLLEWFRSYKMADTKKLNLISKQLYDKKESEELITKTHHYYLEFLQDVKKLKEEHIKENIKENIKEHIKEHDYANTQNVQSNYNKLNNIDDEIIDNNLLEDINITYYKSDSSYKPDLNIWTP
ncbi:putative inorganic pyrophosphatase [Plasmodium gaboni]|nr:putative inorganic pyrophosphatase [Plasmodium gaboni]KYO03276.1 putative inorganic pyrophosphatase [Plasmodium gaboni]